MRRGEARWETVLVVSSLVFLFSGGLVVGDDGEWWVGSGTASYPDLLQQPIDGGVLNGRREIGLRLYSNGWCWCWWLVVARWCPVAKADAAGGGTRWNWIPLSSIGSANGGPGCPWGLPTYHEPTSLSH
ncbi:hypothetical protein B0T17DRAFT_373686 [Bombardia bombarda]|uniref:Uncharacterized protein n=1 Tax=Bombardia bombarda TaxID=252184 RepID=A0AA39WGH2_9PEZI|nr:hypothetical protein B0T17DRAFT_373686 [Bombardia bombarda]